jgi:heat shock protein HslJ
MRQTETRLSAVQKIYLNETRGNMKYINTKTLIVIFTMIAFAATAAFAKPDRLSTEQWKLVQIDGKRITDDSKAYLEINIGQTRFTGNAGCNRMFGGVDVKGKKIDFSQIGTTRMFCTGTANRTEQAFVRALEDATRYRQVGDTLEVYKRNQLTLKFTAIRKGQPGTPKPTRLEDAKWVLESIQGRPAGKTAEQVFVNFDAKKGSAGGNTGCNVFGGSYSEKGGKLTITDVISTMRACEEDGKMQLERSLLDGLRSANRFEINSGKLHLYRNNALLMTFSGRNK